MYSKLQPVYPSGPTNRTDPIVRHDPAVKWGTVVKLYNSQDHMEDGGVQGTPNDPTKHEAIFVPLVKLNNYVLELHEITWFKLYCDRFTPYLDITVDDIHNKIQFNDVPGLDNVITVVIIAPVDGVYKKIHMDFYITNVSYTGSTISYTAELKLLPLEKTRLEQIKFYHPSPGCPAKFCQLGPNEHPTTYEFLHVLALDCGLGFAATQQTKEVKDDKWRIASSEKNKNLIIKHTAFGGTSEEEIFDSWVDLFGFLTMVNVPWVMNENVKPNELGIIAMHNTIAQDIELNIPSASKGMVHRTLTNINKMSALNNMMIESWENIVSTDANFNKGTLNTYNVFKPKGNGGENSVDTNQIKQVEMSQDGVKNADKYEFERTTFTGVEQCRLNGTQMQKQYHDKYFEKIRSKMLKVTLSLPNLGIERGTLINIAIFEYSMTNKRKIVSSATSMLGDESADDPGNNMWGDILEPENPILNPAVSGMYYVDGMDFEYDSISQKLKQSLYLIKKGNITNLNYNSIPNKLLVE